MTLVFHNFVKRISVDNYALSQILKSIRYHSGKLPRSMTEIPFPLCTALQHRRP